MIPLLIYTLYKKYRTQGWIGNRFKRCRLLSIRFRLFFGILLFVILVLVPLFLKAQKQQLNYKIIQGRNDIGWLKIERNVLGNKADLLLVSEVKTRILFLITVSAKESSTFENGKLVYSNLFRKTNGAVKLDRQMSMVDGQYEVLEKGVKKNLILPFISTNLLSMYFQEPTGIAIVFCDYHQCFAPIIKTGNGGYRVKFPDGSSNCFYYKGGICNKIEISTTFYTVIILLNAKNN